MNKRKNILISDTVKYIDGDGQHKAVYVIDEIYLPPGALHSFKIKDIQDGHVSNISAKELYMRSISIRGKKGADRRLLTLEKMKKKRRAFKSRGK